MNQKELNEIRRRFKPDRTAISKVYGCYVSSARQIISYIDAPMGLMSQEEQEMFLNLLKKSLSGALGRNLIDIVFSTAQVADSDEHRLLQTLRQTALQDPNAREMLYRRIIDSIDMGDSSYLILLAADAYDVPRRGSDDQVLADGVDSLSAAMNALRKETMALFRYYSQLDDVACELCENENGFFSETETERFHLFEGRVARLRENAQLLCEYCRQIQSAFQAQIDIRQNRVMQILTIVTTIFLPLTLLTGWYGMNFVNMPELSAPHGYAIICLLCLVCLLLEFWVIRKNKWFR